MRERFASQPEETEDASVLAERIEMELVRVAPDGLAEWAGRLRDWGFHIDPSVYRWLTDASGTSPDGGARGYGLLR